MTFWRQNETAFESVNFFATAIFKTRRKVSAETLTRTPLMMIVFMVPPYALLAFDRSRVRFASRFATFAAVSAAIA